MNGRIYSIDVFRKQTYGNDDFMKRMASAFVESVQTDLEQLKQSMEVKNAKLLHHVAHKLKSSFGILGSTLLAEQARALELQAREENPECWEGVPEFVEKIRLLSKQLEEDFQ